MGIDAEILVRRVPESIVTDEWLKDMSWRMCKAIGAEHFFIEDGMLSDVYRPAIDAWHAAFDRHPRVAEFRLMDHGKERQELHAAILADLGKPPKERCLALDKTLSRYREDDSPPPGDAYIQDGDDILAAHGECLLEVSLCGRYYGEGYERGDLLTYCAIAEWLELNIPGCEVWYGGDSSGVCAKPWPETERRRLRNHLYSKDGRAYFDRFGTSMGGDGCKAPESCSLCPRGTYAGIRNGFGRNGLYAAFHCGGCGKSVVTEDGGKTYAPVKRDNWSN